MGDRQQYSVLLARPCLPVCTHMHCLVFCHKTSSSAPPISSVHIQFLLRSWQVPVRIQWLIHFFLSSWQVLVRINGLFGINFLSCISTGVRVSAVVNKEWRVTR